MTKVWEKVIEEDEIQSVRINEDRSQIHRSQTRESGNKITFIPAKIVTVHKQADKHRVVVRILVRKYRGSFNTLIFGKNKPLIGSCHDGRLDLIYYRDPGLEEGQSFPLWTFNNRVSDCALEAFAQRSAPI